MNPTLRLPRWSILIVLLALPALHAATGEELFSASCASCHGADGKARTPIGRKLGAKDLGASQFTLEAVVQQITNGKKNERGAEKMPAFKEKLTPDEINAIAHYVMQFRK